MHSATAIRFRDLIRPHLRDYLIGLLALLVVNPIELLLPWLVQLAIDSLSTPRDSTFYRNIGLVLILAALIQGFARYVWRQRFVFNSFRTANQVRKQLFHHILRLDLNYFSKNKVGDLISLGSNDIEAVRRASGIGLLIIADLLIHFALIPTLLILKSWILALSVLTPILAVPILTRILGRYIERGFERVQRQQAIMAGIAQDTINNIRTIKSFNRSDAFSQRFRNENETLVTLALSLIRIEALFFPAVESLLTVGIFVSLLFGGYIVAKGDMTVGQFVSFQMYVLLLTWPMMGLGWVVSLLKRGRASLGRINNALTRVPAVHVVDKAPQSLPPKDASICFNHVSLTYPEAETPALKATSFEIPSGQFVGLTGPVGSGKTTLFDLICRFWNPDNGTITIGQKPLQTFSDTELRDQIALVRQEPFIFSGPLRENIRFDMLSNGETPVGDLETGDDVLIELTRMVHLWHDIDALPDQFSAELGEKGINLSGGQRQRLALARALYKSSPVLLLDDVFSNLDVETEQRILEAILPIIRHRSKPRTTLLISHRISTLRYCDTIMVIEDGQVTGFDPMAVLVKQHPYMKHLLDINPETLDICAHGST